MKWQELITDPSSCQLSMSRFCFGIIVVAILLVSGGMVLGFKLNEAGDLLKNSLLITAGLYGANSVAGAITPKKEIPCEKDQTTVTTPTTTIGPMG